MRASILDRDDLVRHPLAPGRNAYLHVARGSVVANGVALAAGDALKVSDETLVTLGRAQAAEVLLFDLPI